MTDVLLLERSLMESTLTKFPDLVYIDNLGYRITSFGTSFNTDRGCSHTLSHWAVSLLRASGAVFSNGKVYSLHQQPKDYL